MNIMSMTVLALLCGAVFGTLGYLHARSRTALQRADLEAALKVAEERARQAGLRVDELNTVHARWQEKIADSQRQVAGLHAENRMLREQAATVEAVRAELERSREENNRLQADSFRALAAEMLDKSQQKLVTAADDRLTATSVAIRDRLQQLDQSLRQFEKGRIEADTQLGRQITDLVQQAAEGRRQIRTLVEALRKPQVRGAWGEMHLKRSVELAGLQEHCDFDTQVQVDGDDGGRLRPDMVVHLTGGKHVVVDAKVSLAAFLAATEATDEDERERHWDLERVLEEARPERPRLRSDLATRTDPAPPPTTTVGELLRDGRAKTNRLSLRKGTRIAAGLIRSGDDPAVRARSYPVLGPPEILGRSRPGGRWVDRIAFEAAYPNARRSLPGDVVITDVPEPGVLVDHAGYSVVEYPARILRLTERGRERFTPRVLAALLARSGRAGGAIRSVERLEEVRLPLLSAKELARFDELLREIDERRDHAQKEIDALDALRRITTTGLSDGTLTISDQPPR